MTIRKRVICFFLENHSAPPDVTTYTSEHPIQVERPQGSTTSRTAPKYGNAELMETGDGRSPGGHGASFVNPVPAPSHPRAADADLCRGSHGRRRGVSDAQCLLVGQECFCVGKNTGVVWRFILGRSRCSVGFDVLANRSQMLVQEFRSAVEALSPRVVVRWVARSRMQDKIIGTHRLVWFP